MTKLKKNKKMSSFSGSKLPQKFIQWAETAKNGFKCFKMHSNAYSPKKGKQCKQMLKNCKKCQKITNNCKILEIT